MYLFDFECKLKKLNSGIYIKPRGMRAGWDLAAIFLRVSGRRYNTHTRGALHYASAKQQKALEDASTGQVDLYLGGIGRDWVPEFDQFASDGTFLRKGWRTVLRNLLAKGIVARTRVNKYFSSSIGEYDHDHWTFEMKREDAKHA